tara:strand:+ start:474 stop:692 length:219 start_codon:yes stop_codon:yes gene_type:complete
MSKEKTPFEKAEENIRMFAESAELLHNLNELKKLLEDAKKLSEIEQEGINTIVDLTIENLCKHYLKKDGRWN